MDNLISNFFEDATVAVTGGVGSVGLSLVKRLLKYNIREIVVIDQNESELFYLEQAYKHESRVTTFQEDIKNTFSLSRIFTNVDYVFHTAALKHVPSCEKNPYGAVENNINGMLSLIEATQNCGVKKVIFTSSDKAVNPTNVMGATKLIGERLVIGANTFSPFKSDRTKFSVTRFGNVAGTRGSVIPLFCEQIKNGQALTLTDPQMTRFMMSMENAVDLVIQSMAYAQGGEIFVTKMPTMKIIDLAEVLVEIVAPLYGRSVDDIRIDVIGSRPGEKLYEELSSCEESKRLLENDDYLCILPNSKNFDEEFIKSYTYLNMKRCVHTYQSDKEKSLTKDQIRQFLFNGSVLPDNILTLLKRV